MDGTLLDTERVYFDSLVAALNAYGYTDDVDSAVPCDGRPSRPGMRGHAARALWRKLSARRRSTRPSSHRRDEILDAGLPLKRGAVELLDALQAAEYPMAIVTSSSRRTADAHLTARRNPPPFRHDPDPRRRRPGKPSPDLYLLAASRFGVTPESCVAVEDSNHGVTAAHAAGAITIMVPDMVPPTDESRARCAAVVPDLGAVRRDAAIARRVGAALVSAVDCERTSARRQSPTSARRLSIGGQARRSAPRR